MTKFLAALAVVCATAALAAQVPPQAPGAQEALPSFEVASVRVNRSAQGGRFIRPQPGGRFETTNMRLRDLIGFAYQVRPFQIEGGPDWMDSVGFDIVAKAEGDVPPPLPGAGPSPQLLMLRSLLIERFKLSVRRETKESAVYDLTLARADGRLGPNLSPSTTDCAALLKAAMKAGGPPMPPMQNDRMTCGMRMSPSRVDLGGLSLTEFVNGLGMLLQRTVVDRTGLTGNYDATMTFSPEQLPGLPLPPPGAAGTPPLDPNAPSLFTALQEQLGLKLESTRGPVEVLIVDRAEMPMED
jgi:bla regulator protein BlaR1